MNISYCWLEYKRENSYGYGQSQFYEYYNRFVTKNFGSSTATMTVHREPGEKMYIDWVGDQPELIYSPETATFEKVHIFVTTLGVISLMYVELFKDEKLPNFIEGTVNALKFYDGVPKYLVPDNLKAAVTKSRSISTILLSIIVFRVIGILHIRFSHFSLGMNIDNISLFLYYLDNILACKAIFFARTVPFPFMLMIYLPE